MTFFLPLRDLADHQPNTGLQQTRLVQALELIIKVFDLASFKRSISFDRMHLHCTCHRWIRESELTRHSHGIVYLDLGSVTPEDTCLWSAK